MKHRIYIIGIVVMLLGALAAGCIDDRGNYDYQPAGSVVPAKISGLEASYGLIFGTTRTLTAVVEGLEQEENYQFMWYIYKMPSNSLRDTLGYGKTLEWKITQETGKYHLWFEVRDKRTDVCVNQKMDVEISTIFSTGWYVVKDADGVTDVDFVDKDNRLMPDILATNTGVNLPGKAVKILYNSNYTHDVENPDGTVTKLTKQKVFLVLSDRDMKVVNAENLMLYKNFEDCFYEAPVAKRPANLLGNPNQLNLINNGKFHMWAGSSTNSGKFSYAKTGTYGAHPDMVDIASSTIVVFDTLSRSFFYFDNNSSGPNPFVSPLPGAPSFGSPENMDAKLKCFLFWKSVYVPNPYAMYYHAYAVMQNDAGKYYLATFAFDKDKYPLAGYDEIPAGCRIGTGTAHACHKSVACIYFAEKNKLYAHEVGTSKDPAVRERVMHTFSGSEEIAVIRHVSLPSTKEDYLAVITNSLTGWRLYRFPLITGTSEADFSNVQPLAQGWGTARYCTYLLSDYER